MISNPQIKYAGLADIPFLWYVRNQKEIYQYFKNPRPISWEEHINFIVPIIIRAQPILLYIIRHNGIPIGYIRIDIDKQSNGQISIAVLASFQGKGLASRALKKLKRLLKKKSNVKKLTAEIHKDNRASDIFFQKNGFVCTEKHGNYETHSLSLIL